MPTWTEALRRFIEQADALGVLVMCSGVVLNNITTKQLQDMMQIRKTTNSDGKGVVSYLPQAFIDNTLAAFDLPGVLSRARG